MEADFCLFHWVHNVLFLRASNFRAEVEPSNFCYIFISLLCYAAFYEPGKVLKMFFGLRA